MKDPANTVLVGRQIGGLAAIMLGAFILLWHDFATPWENVPVTGSARDGLAWLTGTLLLVCGAGLFWRRTARPACIALAVVAACFTLLWALVVSRAPQVYDSWGNVAEQSSIAAGLAALLASLAPGKTDNDARLAIGGRLWFGVCALSFGVVHFENFKGCASFVPNWLPFGGGFWAGATGVAHLAVAVAFLSGIWARLASRLAAIMYLGFGLLCWGGILAGHPADHYAWGGEIITLTLAAAAWMVGDSVAVFPPKDGELFLPRWS